MKILFVDDLPGRWQAFLQVEPARAGADWAKDYEQAKRLLETHQYDTIWLDHDLCLDDILKDPADPTVWSERNGTDVARVIVETQHALRCCVIHTLNDAGADSIRRVLEAAGIACDRRYVHSESP